LVDIPQVITEIVAASAQHVPLVVGVAGLSNAGKTTLCQLLTSELAGRVLHLRCDDFSVHSYRQRSLRAEDPRDWCAWDDVQAVLQVLRVSHRAAYDRGWNRETGELNVHLDLRLPDHPNPVVLCDGSYLLHSPVRDMFDRLLFVDTPVEIALERGRTRAVRNGRPGSADYSERLTRAVPYFEEFACVAHWTWRAAAP
jgi:uridine kinase